MDNRDNMNDVNVISKPIKREETLREGHDQLITFFDNINLSNIQTYREIYIVILKIGSFFTKSTDLLQEFHQDKIRKLQQGKAIVIFDNAAEGFNESWDFPITDMLEYNHQIYGLPPYTIIYTTSNLLHKNTVKPIISTFAYSMFETDIFSAEHIKKSKQNLYSVLNESIRDCCVHNRHYFYSALSRKNRPYRTIAQYYFSDSDISYRGLISHDTLDSKEDLESTYKLLPHFGCDKKRFDEWRQRLPLIVDRRDFNVNWANVHSSGIFSSTLFQVVNETLYDTNTIFYSEKTWRPLMYLQPFIIWGSPGMNKYLHNLGYQLYTPWFNLSWDDEVDPIKRFKGLFESVRNTCYTLETLSYRDRIKWRFKRADILAHNYYNLTVRRPREIIKNLENFLYKIDGRRKLYDQNISRRS